MTRKRGAPVLIELISRPNGPSVGGSPVAAPTERNGGGRGGSPVSNPDTWGPASSRGNGTATRSDMRLPAMLIGAGIVIVVVAAIVGFQLGQKKERQGWVDDNAAGSGLNQNGEKGAGGATPGASGANLIAPPPTVTDPLNATASNSTKPPVPAPAPSPATDVGLQDGWNYLVVATLRRTEAEEAARYLVENEIPVQLVPYERGGVDRGGGGANNARWQLWILRGVPPGAFSKTQAERDALKSRIEMLGRTWKAKNRQAPTDFAESYWQKK